MNTKIYKTTTGYRYKLITSVYKKWIKDGNTILDIGCGTGIITKLLIDEYNVHITGCDIKNYLLYDIPFLKIKGERLPVKDHTFNMVLLNDVLHHIDKLKQKEILIEAIRVADKVLIFEAEPTLLGKLADIVLNRYHYGSLATPLSFRTKAEWQKLFKSLSLKSQGVKLKRPFWYPFSHIAFMVSQ